MLFEFHDMDEYNVLNYNNDELNICDDVEFLCKTVKVNNVATWEEAKECDNKIQNNNNVQACLQYNEVFGENDVSINKLLFHKQIYNNTHYMKIKKRDINNVKYLIKKVKYK